MLGQATPRGRGVPDDTNRPDPAEITEAAWLRLDEARDRLTFKSSIEILDAARALLTEGGIKAAP